MNVKTLMALLRSLGKYMAKVDNGTPVFMLGLRRFRLNQRYQSLKSHLSKTFLIMSWSKLESTRQMICVTDYVGLMLTICCGKMPIISQLRNSAIPKIMGL